jgi:hypothetical protein
LQGVDDGGNQEPGQGEGAVVFGVAANLQHLFAPFGEGDGDVATGGGFANATFAIDRESFTVAPKPLLKNFVQPEFINLEQ